MKKIAILGCENSHADAFLKCIGEKEEFRDVEVVGVYSDDPAAAQKLKESFGTPVLTDYADAVGKIDGLMITARHGDSHCKFAKPYLASGIPMFIDKPITIREDEAVDLMRALKSKGTPVSGGSSLKQDALVKQLKLEAQNEVGGRTLGGYVRAPYQKDSIYGGFYFYAQHLVEMVCEIFGHFPISVTARENGGHIHVLFHYENYDCVGLFCNGSYVYFASRMAQNAANALTIPITGDWFYEEFKEFYALLSGKAQSTPYETFIAPVFIMNAIVRALESGKEERITYEEI